MGKELAIDTGLSETLISIAMADLCKAGLACRGYSITRKGKRRLWGC